MIKVVQIADYLPAPAPMELFPNALYPQDMPDVYAMMCHGDCMEPYFKDGQKLCFSRYAPIEMGDPVVLFRRPEFVLPGESQLIFKRLLSSPPASYWQGRASFTRGNLKPLVIVEMMNPVRQLRYDADSILGMHKCVGSLDEEDYA